MHWRFTAELGRALAVGKGHPSSQWEHPIFGGPPSKKICCSIKDKIWYELLRRKRDVKCKGLMQNTLPSRKYRHFCVEVFYSESPCRNKHKT